MKILQEKILDITRDSNDVDSILSLIQQEIRECIKERNPFSVIEHKKMNKTMEKVKELNTIYLQALSDIKEKLKEKGLIWMQSQDLS